MTITAKIVADSLNTETGDRLTTMQLRYQRFIHCEFMTHRVFSRSASSSRAVPVERMIQDVLDDPAMPVEWGSNKPGMQAGDEIDKLVECYPIEEDAIIFDERSPEFAWVAAMEHAVIAARGFAKAGYHKQIVNRLLEPFAHISVVVTATEWENFFALRCHPDADPTMRALAEAMRDAMEKSHPVEMERFDWHLPYLTEEEKSSGLMRRCARISAARCARVSYMNHDGSNPDIEKDLALAQRLIDSRHMSPFEHQARVTDGDGTQHWRNFQGWDQHRSLVETVLAEEM